MILFVGSLIYTDIQIHRYTDTQNTQNMHYRNTENRYTESVYTETQMTKENDFQGKAGVTGGTCS